MNKKIINPLRKLLIAGTILVTGISTSESVVTHKENTAEASSYKSGKNFYEWGSCVFYAFNRRVQLGKPVSNSWGSAKNWAYNAKRAGYHVSYRPSKHAIMISQKGYWGHASVVERINRNGSVLVSEMNYPRKGVKTYRTISAWEARTHQFIK